ncbi:hypothetical protein EVAR_36225_1 [Eumeta japonica]|uniref:Uncharacterized protein n=1 Tax=Eumeta variegata TaxID=151549 RepID=A0A4C1VT07_EUMVA|nr:hypothetical protein EVAR_36225_1 [Eumeta japonica]
MVRIVMTNGIESFVVNRIENKMWLKKKLRSEQIGDLQEPSEDASGTAVSRAARARISIPRAVGRGSGGPGGVSRASGQSAPEVSRARPLFPDDCRKRFRFYADRFLHCQCNGEGYKQLFDVKHLLERLVVGEDVQLARRALPFGYIRVLSALSGSALPRELLH